MQQQIQAEWWYRLRRLELAGLRLPYQLIAPNHPLRVEHLRPAMGQDVFPVVNGVGVAISVRITAGAPITIGNYRLSWDAIPELSLPGEMKPLDCCARCSSDRVRRFCFELSSGHRTIELPNLQKEKIWAGGALKRDLWLQGCFSALLGAEQRFPSVVVSATLNIVDVMGNEYPYPLRLNVSPELVVSPSAGHLA